MTRREIREHVFRLLFINEFHEPDEIAEINERYFETFFPEITEESRLQLLTRYSLVKEKYGEIDVIIQNASSGWKLSRIGKVELTLLRLATYEIKFDEEVPDKAAINEAVEIAKIYGGDLAYGFINGILSKVI